MAKRVKESDGVLELRGWIKGRDVDQNGARAGAREVLAKLVRLRRRVDELESAAEMACAAQLRARAECLRRYAADASERGNDHDASAHALDASEADACAAIVASVTLTAPAATTGGE